MILRRSWLALLVLTLMGCSSTQPGGLNALNPTAGPSNAAAKITYRDGSVEYISQATLDQYQNQIFIDPQGAAPAELVLNELITQRLMLRLARNNDITADPQIVERSVGNLRDQFCFERIQQAGVPVQGNDPRSVEEACGRALGFNNGNEFRSFIAEQITINNAAGDLAPKDQIRAAHILFNAEDYVKAEETYNKLCGNDGFETQPSDAERCDEGAPNTFTALARELSVEPNAQQSGGELPAFNEQGLTDDNTPFDTTFVSNTWALKPAFEETGLAISQPFETQFGWHIVKVLELTASDQAQQNFRDRVLERARDAQPAELSDPESATSEFPLVAAAEVLISLPAPSVLPTIEVPLPEETVGPEVTSTVPEEGGTATPDETAPATP